MSEYQYYEFLAVDRPLTQNEMAELRKITSRATITPSRLQNVYQWGDFKGDPGELMEKYFDAFLYVANWGTNQFMLRLPVRLLDAETASLYCLCDSASSRVSGQNIILNFFPEDEEAEGWLPSLIPLRAEVAAGDLRYLYLGWLHCPEIGQLDDEEMDRLFLQDSGNHRLPSLLSPNSCASTMTSPPSRPNSAGPRSTQSPRQTSCGNGSTASRNLKRMPFCFALLKETMPTCSRSFYDAFIRRE